MKPFYFIIYLLLLPALRGSAQKGQPAFGKVNMEDMAITDCDFDKGADALVLLDYGNAYFDSNNPDFFIHLKTIFERRTRIKILKEKGIEQANVEIPFFSHNGEEKILKVKAFTYNLDEDGKIKITAVKRNSFYYSKTDRNYSKLIITFPQVKAGSIIEYRYTIETTGRLSIPNWNFQQSIPVRYSEYQLTIPQVFRFNVKTSVVDTMEEKKEVIDEYISGSGKLVKTKSIKSNYIMRNLEGIKEEPYMTSPKDYLQGLQFLLTQVYYNEDKTADVSLQWKDVVRNLMNHEDFGLQLTKKSKAIDDFIEEAKKITDLQARMKFIFYQVKNLISCNGDEQVFAGKGIVNTWETKTGNTADINLLLIKLLTGAGIDAKPILFSTIDNGLAMPYYANISQFNTVLAFVTINSKTFVLDAADKINDYRLVPEKVVNTKGFIVDGEDGIWKEIKAEKKIKTRVAVQGEIEETGSITGTALLSFYDYAAMQKQREWLAGKQKYESDLSYNYPSLQIDDITANNPDTSLLHFEQKIKFSSTLNTSGQYHYFTLNLFSGFTQNPFLADNRIADIDFGVAQEYSFFGSYLISPEFVFDGVPENIFITTSDNSVVFNRSIQVESNLLNVRMTLEFKQSHYPASSYPELKEFYKKLFDKLNEQVVIKKK